MTARGATGPTPERLALAARVQDMIEVEGLTKQAVAERLGISRSYASSLYADPDGLLARKRKESYSGVCELCGGPTCGSGGRDLAPSLCMECSSRLQHENRYWTPDRIIATFKEFKRLTGRQPTAFERNPPPSVVRKMSPERIAEVKASVDAAAILPNPSVVYRELGSWVNALRLAGMEEHRGGATHHRSPYIRTSNRADVLSLLYTRPMTARQLSEAGGASWGTCHSCVKRLEQLGLVTIVGREAKAARRRRGRQATIYGLTEAGVREVEQAWTNE